MNKYLKYSLKAFAILLGIFLLLYVIAYVYVSANKKSIIAQVTRQISEKLNGTVNIGNVDLSFISTFPQISVLLQKVSIRDSMFNQHKHPFFTADKLYARISVFQVIAKKDPLTGLKVENGNLYVFTDTSGYTNNYLLQGKRSEEATRPTAAKRTVLDNIKMHNFNITLRDEIKNKWLEFDIEKMLCDIDDRDSILTFDTRNNILVKSLAFNLEKGSYVKGKRFTGNFKLKYDQRTKNLFFKNIAVRLDKQPYQMSGSFILDKQPRFSLAVNTRKLDFNEGKSLLPEKVALVIARYSLSKPIDINANISGPLKGGDPLVKLNWNSQNGNTVTAPFFTFTDCNFTGGYTNELIPGLPRKDPNSRIWIHNFSGDWEGIPLRSQNTYIDNLAQPMINLDLKSDFSLAALNDVLQSSSIKLNSGRAALNVTYSGPLTKNSDANTKLNGTLAINDGQVVYAPRNVPLNNCNGAIVFENTDVGVKDLRTTVEGNLIIMNGNIKNMLSLMKSNPGKTSLQWSVYSPKLNLSALTGLLKKRRGVAKTYSRKNKLGGTASQIDDVLEQSNVALSLKTDELTYKKFTATNIRAAIDLVEDSWKLNNVSLQSGGGAMQMSGSIRQKKSGLQNVQLKVNVDDADVNKVMYAFNNFGQDGISYTNLRGKLSADVDVALDLPEDLTGAPQNMNGDISFSLKNGALVNYEPLKKLQIFLFKNRNFDDVRFAELKDHFKVDGKDIIMDRMEIQSTVLTLFVEGIFSMQPGKTDISIQVPISNIRKRDAQPRNKGSDSKGGASIYVRGRPGEDGNIKFKLDLFKKFRKDKKDDEADEKGL